MEQSSNQPFKVCMFVWNHFTHDARVTREAKSLVQAGYDVCVIALHDHKDISLPRRQTKDGISVIRICRLGFFYKTKNRMVALRNKMLSGLSTKKSHVSRSSHFFEPSAHLISAFFHLGMSIWCFAYFLTKLPVYVIDRLTLGLGRLLAAYIITTAKFTTEGLKAKARIYHCHDLNTLLAGYVCSRINKARLVYDSHEICTDKAGLRAKPFWRLLERMLIRKPDEVIFTTYTRARFTADKYNIELPEVIGNVTDIPEKIKQMDLRRALDLNNGVKIALYQGGIQLGRGLEQLIDAAPLLSPNIVLVLVGDGRLRPVLEARVETLNLSERVKFTGRVPLDELLGYTACADVGLQILQNMCFNHYSTDSNKLYEYLTVGVPVVASDFPEIRRVIQEFDVGILIDPHKPENIAEAVNRMLADLNRYDEMKRNAVRAVSVHNWNNESKKLLAIYHRLEDEINVTSN